MAFYTVSTKHSCFHLITVYAHTTYVYAVNKRTPSGFIFYGCPDQRDKMIEGLGRFEAYSLLWGRSGLKFLLSSLDDHETTRLWVLGVGTIIEKTEERDVGRLQFGCWPDLRSSFLKELKHALGEFIHAAFTVHIVFFLLSLRFHERMWVSTVIKNVSFRRGKTLSCWDLFYISFFKCFKRPLFLND